MTPSPLRKLAIRLACIHAEDRDWILGQLAADEARQVNELLQEIETLGLASDPSVVNAVMAELTSQGAARPVQPPMVDEGVAALGRAGHPAWAALALQLREKDQRRKLIDGLPNAATVRRWDSLFGAGTVPPALAQCLSRHLGEREPGHD
ncbi:hypothetical protein ACIP1T_18890 [Pseudomonas japonica]|uniref:hypothetical protein n=1 Tax=Pseudomonas japonica TaxID=256466 RepID=UPI0038236C86